MRKKTWMGMGLTKNFLRLETAIETLQFLFFGRFLFSRRRFVAGNWTDTFSLLSELIFTYGMTAEHNRTHQSFEWRNFTKLSHWIFTVFGFSFCFALFTRLFKCLNQIRAIQIFFWFPCVLRIAVAIPFEIIFDLRETVTRREKKI